jgi:O-antigen/teichoic acid export membrane protein
VAVKLLATEADKATVGRFVAALIVARVPLFLFASVQASALPRLSRLAAGGRRRELRGALRRLLVAVGAFGLAGTLGAALVGPAVLQLFFGSEFRLGRADLAYLAAASAFYMLAMTVAQALIALRAPARVAAAWVAAFATFVVVVLAGQDLLLRVERGLLAGSVMALVVTVVLLAGLLGDDEAVPAPTNEELGWPPPTTP